MYDKKPKAVNYYSEKQRAIRESDHIINEILYIKGEAIDLVQLEIKQQPRFLCNFMKIFNQRLELFMEADKNIILDDKIVDVVRD